MKFPIDENQEVLKYEKHFGKEMSNKTVQIVHIMTRLRNDAYEQGKADALGESANE